ncbi:hypothetical protein [Pelomonas sp. BJYL3]|uniref:hypothetical protein n=1 Tax=Pelomonas sp. BJYL3 TaxID=2976697 RepID=UPI0022B50FEC|nr:hypothetical protein [Pelomonas sp. BJYL3]
MQNRLKPRMRRFRARYALANGQSGSLLLVARHSCDAVCIVLNLLGEDARRVSVRPAT